MTGITLGKVAYSCEQYRLHVCGCCELGEHKGLTVELKHGYEGHASIRTLISPSFLVSDWSATVQKQSREELFMMGSSARVYFLPEILSSWSQKTYPLCKLQFAKHVCIIQRRISSETKLIISSQYFQNHSRIFIKTISIVQKVYR